MPRVKRWFPVSHKINRDPEVIELRKKYGNDFIYVWLEILSQCHENKGFIKGDPQNIARFLNNVWSLDTKKRTVTTLKLLQSMEVMGWIRLNYEGKRKGLVLCKYMKYRKGRESKRLPNREPNTLP